MSREIDPRDCTGGSDCDERPELIKKADAIARNAIIDQDGGDPRKEYLAACRDMAKACALLTSTVKAEREEGKAMVRRWKNGNSF